MKVAGLDEKAKGFIIEFVNDAAEILGKLGSPVAMPVVDAFIDPLGVVKDCKELNNIPLCPCCLRKAPPVFQHPRPMRHTVDPF